jgi:hypothetical protein
MCPGGATVVPVAVSHAQSAASMPHATESMRRTAEADRGR